MVHHTDLRLFRCPTALLFGALALALGFLISCSRPTGMSGLAGAPDSLIPPKPSSPEPSEIWITPSGRRFESGTVDELGYALPLDVHRGPRPKASAMEPPQRRPPGWWNEAKVGQEFFEIRIGSDDGHTQNETSIDVQGDTLVAGWNQFTESSLVMGVGRSIDSAKSWSWELFDGHTVMSDPAVKAGGGGRWYFAYLGIGGIGGGDAEIYVRRSLDDGAAWEAPVQVTNNTGFDDKPYIDVLGDEVLAAWADFSFSPARVRAARSLDGGQTWGNDTVLVSPPAGGNGACPVIAADGTYYVFWRGSSQEFLWMSRSDDQGDNWTVDAAIAEMSPLPSSLPGGFRIVNLPSADADPLTGHLVVLWNDQLFGNPDILSTRSEDGGDTWSEPVRVNDDVGTDAQFFPWVTIDSSGIVHAMWYDRRENGFDIDVYYAVSLDGGVSYEPNVRVTAESYTPVLPPESGAADFIGDYNAIAAGGGKAFPFYQDARTGSQDVYVAVVPAIGPIFADGFESGDTSAWSSTNGAQ